ncbi:unnamed protein product [Ectocarpus sp. 6 AP-2014]
MSAELYERQMAWKEFISQRSDEQGRAIVSNVYRSSMPDRWQVDLEENQGTTPQQLLASNTSSSLLATRRSGRSSSSGKTTGMLQNKALSSMDGCGGAREQHQQQQRRKRQDAASSRHATTTATPAPSYSSMLAARRSSTSAVGVPSQESSRLQHPGASSVEKTGGLKIADFSSSRRVSSSSKHRVGDDVSRQATARVRAASITRGRRTPPQAAAGGDQGESGAIEETATTVTTKKTAAAAAATAAATADPPLVLRQAVSAPTKSRAGSSSSSCCGGGDDGNDGEEPARSRDISAVSTAGEAQAAPGAATAVVAAERQRASRQQQRQGSLPLHTSSGRKKPSRVLENRGRRASGSVAMVSAGASTATCSTAGTAAAATAAAAAAGRTEGISMHSDDGGAGRYQRVVTRRSSDTACPAVDLGQKERAWKRERAQLLTVIKLQHRQLMMRPSSSSSCSWADASPSGDSVGTASTAATTAPPAEPASPRSSPCVSNVTPPPPPPPPPPLQPRQRHRPSRPSQSLTPPPAAREAPIIASRPPPRTHLLGRVELQREKAAARGVGRLQAGRGRGLASAGSVKSRSDSGSSCPDSSAVAGPTAAPRGFPAESEDGRRGGGGCRDDSEYGGGGNAATVSPSRRCCVEGRLEVMERNVTAVLRRLDELEKRKSKGGNGDRSVQSTRSDRHVHAV